VALLACTLLFECFNWRLIVECLMTAVVVVVGGIGSQPALGAGLTAVLCFVEPLDSHRIGLKELFNDVAVSVVEITAEISLGKGSQVAHAINEKPRVWNGLRHFWIVATPVRYSNPATRANVSETRIQTKPRSLATRCFSFSSSKNCSAGSLPLCFESRAWSTTFESTSIAA